MDTAREESNWKMTKWLLAQMELCRTSDASKIKLDPESWNIPERERRLEEQEAERQRQESEAREAANDPAVKAEFIKRRIAEFNRFKAQLRGPVNHAN